jgi:hypothetical protein
MSLKREHKLRVYENRASSEGGRNRRMDKSVKCGVSYLARFAKYY